jgi:hypothetical protein
MTIDDIIRMAKEAGLEFVTDNLEEFSNLVAAAEREACAKGCEHFGGFKDGYSCAAYIRARGQE